MLNEYDKLVICNGCRPSWLSKRIPDKLEEALKPYFDEIFKEACNEHDICYFSGGDEKCFKECNKKFYKAMKKSIKRNSHWYSRLWFYYKAWEYYKLVSKFGKPCFHWNSGNGLTRLFPSQSPVLNQKMRAEKIECVWMDNENRWYTRKEREEILS